MNAERLSNEKDYKSLLLLDEISKGEHLSQRDLSRRLNIALGLVNSFIQNLAAKGCVKVKGIPPRRYAYYLTPKGFAEKTRLTYHYLHNYTSFYRNARKDFQKLFNRLGENEIRRVVFAGLDMMAEIAYLSLQEANLDLVGVLDDDGKMASFFKYAIHPINEISTLDYQGVVITTFGARDRVYETLRNNSVPPGTIWSIFHDGGFPDV